MKNLIKVKQKIFLVIFLCMNCVLQPICIYYYRINRTDTTNIILHLISSLYLTFCFSLFINESIGSIIFRQMLKGRIIRNRYYFLYQSFYFLLLILVLAVWLINYIIKGHSLSLLLAILIIVLFQIKQTYFISYGSFVCGLRVIPLEVIHWYHVDYGKHTGTLTLKYLGDKHFITTNSVSCLKELSASLAAHNIYHKM